ncbi:MAG: outer membrane protein assembly factor BamA [Gammaproteobacteria bacterium]
MKLLYRLSFLFALLLASVVSLADSFTVSDIRIRGLQRIPVERVYAVLPVKAGDVVDARTVAHLVRQLYASGDFQDVQVGRDGDQLVIQLAERPAVSKIEISGNKSIDSEDLLKGLKESGLAEGEVFRRATLENMQVELQRQYIAQGRYGARVDAKVTPQPRNRVAIKIDIHEGKAAWLGGIRFIGNRVWSDDELMKVIKLREHSGWSIFNSDDKYAREKLAGDLESLRSWYMDRGYINFQVKSTQVSVTPDRRQVFVAIGMDEGEKYTVSEVALAGALPVAEAQLLPLILVRPQQTFSQQLVTTSSEILTRRLGVEGYVFAEVRGIPELDEEKRTVKMTFFVDAGDRMYVNRINFIGNNKTRDDVLRREMRQFEGGPASQAAVDQSKRRLEQLGYFGKVKSATARVPGSSDLIDINYTVEEQPSGSIGANIGYSQGYGLVFGANVSQNNFFGTGNKVSFAVNRSQVRDSVNVSYNNPYYTDDGVSRGWNAYYSKTDFENTNISRYAIDRSGFGVTFGYPLSEVSRLSFGFGYDNAQVAISPFVAEDIWLYVADMGDQYDSYTGNAAWSRSTLNRGMLADRGSYNRIGFDIALPGSDTPYYKVAYTGQRYFPLSRRWTVKARSELAYGDGYGDDWRLPFTQRYFAGGFGSVRGYDDRSLGARSPAHNFVAANTVDPSPDAVGGDMLVEAGLDLIFPLPFTEESRSLRTSLFYDAGNVFLTDGEAFAPDLQELRTSVGVSLSWYTMIGPLSFSLARTLNDQPGDDRQTFQFSLGQPF